MKTICTSNLRKDFFSVVKKIDDYDPILVANRQGKNIVLITQDGYEDLMETLNILSNPEEYDKLMHPEPCSDGPFHSATEMIDFLLNEKD